MDSKSESIIVDFDKKHSIDFDELNDITKSMAKSQQNSVNLNQSANQGAFGGECLENNFKLCLDVYHKIIEHEVNYPFKKPSNSNKQFEYFTENVQIEELYEDSDENDSNLKSTITKAIEKYRELTSKQISYDSTNATIKETKNDFPLLNSQMENIERVVLSDYSAEFPIRIDLENKRISKWPFPEVMESDENSLIFERFLHKCNRQNLTRTERIEFDLMAENTLHEKESKNRFYNKEYSEVYFKDQPIFNQHFQPKSDCFDLVSSKISCTYFKYQHKGRKFVIFWYKSFSSEFDGILKTTDASTNLVDSIKGDIWDCFKNFLSLHFLPNETDKEKAFQEYLNQFSDLPTDTILFYESKKNVEIDHLFFQIDRSYKDFRKKTKSVKPIFIMTISTRDYIPSGETWKQKLKHLMELTDNRVIILDIEQTFKGHDMIKTLFSRDSIENEKERFEVFEEKIFFIETNQSLKEIRRDIRQGNDTTHDLLKSLTKKVEDATTSNQKHMENLFEKMIQNNNKNFEKLLNLISNNNSFNSNITDSNHMRKELPNSSYIELCAQRIIRTRNALNFLELEASIQKLLKESP